MIQAFNDLDAVIVKQKAPKKDKKDPKKPKPAAPRAIGIVAPTMPPAKVPIATLEVYWRPQKTAILTTFLSRSYLENFT